MFVFSPRGGSAFTKNPTRLIRCLLLHHLIMSYSLYTFFLREMTCASLWSVAPRALMGVVQEDVACGWQITTRLARHFSRHRSHQRRGKR